MELKNGGLMENYIREDGPAVIWSDGGKEWWLRGKKITQEEWWNRISDELKVKVIFNGEGL